MKAFRNLLDGARNVQAPTSVNDGGTSAANPASPVVSTSTQSSDSTGLSRRVSTSSGASAVPHTRRRTVGGPASWTGASGSGLHAAQLQARDSEEMQRQAPVTTTAQTPPGSFVPRNVVEQIAQELLHGGEIKTLFAMTQASRTFAEVAGPLLMQYKLAEEIRDLPVQEGKFGRMLELFGPEGAPGTINNVRSAKVQAHLLTKLFEKTPDLGSFEFNEVMAMFRASVDRLPLKTQAVILGAIAGVDGGDDSSRVMLAALGSPGTAGTIAHLPHDVQALALEAMFLPSCRFTSGHAAWIAYRGAVDHLPPAPAFEHLKQMVGAKDAIEDMEHLGDDDLSLRGLNLLGPKGRAGAITNLEPKIQKLLLGRLFTTVNRIRDEDQRDEVIGRFRDVVSALPTSVQAAVLTAIGSAQGRRDRTATATLGDPFTPGTIRALPAENRPRALEVLYGRNPNAQVSAAISEMPVGYPRTDLLKLRMLNRVQPHGRVDVLTQLYNAYGQPRPGSTAYSRVHEGVLRQIATLPSGIGEALKARVSGAVPPPAGAGSGATR